MNDFINEVIKRIKSNPMEIAYSAVIFIIASVLVLLVVRIYLFVRRWYFLSKFRRQSPDFETAKNHILKTNRPLNLIQRFFLGQTGGIIQLSDVLYIVLGAVIGLIINYFFDISETDSGVALLICRIIGALLGLYSLALIPISVYELIENGRIVLFVWALATTLAFLQWIYRYFIVIPI